MPGTLTLISTSISKLFSMMSLSTLSCKQDPKITNPTRRQNRHSKRSTGLSIPRNSNSRSTHVRLGCLVALEQTSSGQWQRATTTSDARNNCSMLVTPLRKSDYEQRTQELLNA